MRVLLGVGVAVLLGLAIGVLALIAHALAGGKGSKPSDADKRVFEETFRQAWLEVNRDRVLNACTVLDGAVYRASAGPWADVTVTYTYDNGGRSESAKNEFNFVTVDGKWHLNGYDLGKLEPPAWREARMATATADIANIQAAAKLFKGDCGRFPTSDEGLTALVRQPANCPNWHGPYLKTGVPKDPWGKPYVYRCPGLHNANGFDLSSAGPYWEDLPRPGISNWSKE